VDWNQQTGSLQLPSLSSWSIIKLSTGSATGDIPDLR
jgi:hypothetical protein